MSNASRPEELAIRPPQQRRTREAWNRILESGVSILEEDGYDGFTIAAVCERAGVAPRAIYARTDTKDALFLAVYDHGIARVVSDHSVLQDRKHWEGLEPREVVRDAVGAVVDIFARHAGFLRPVLLVSSVHEEVHRRGSEHVRDLGAAFTGRLLTVGAHIQHPDPERAVQMCFSTIFGALVLRVAHGRGFAAPEVSDPENTEHLQEVAVNYLLGSGA